MTLERRFKSVVLRLLRIIVWAAFKGNYQKMNPSQEKAMDDARKMQSELESGI